MLLQSIFATAEN